MDSTTSQPTGRATSTALVVLASLMIIGVAVLCAALFPSHVPTPRDPRVLDVVFDSGPVVWATRLLLVSAAFVLAVGGAFVVTSTVVRMRNGDWLRRAGPFEVSEARLAELEDEVHFWRSAAHDCYDELKRLSKVEDQDNELATLSDDYDKL